MSIIVKTKLIMYIETIRRALVRIAHEIIEKNKGVEDVVFDDIRKRSIHLVHRSDA